MGRPRFVAEEVTKVSWINVKGEICHEYDERGNHRITIKGAVGDWVGYTDIATFKLGDRFFAAYSDYWVDRPEIVEEQVVAPRTLSDIYRKE